MMKELCPGQGEYIKITLFKRLLQFIKFVITNFQYKSELCKRIEAKKVALRNK